MPYNLYFIKKFVIYINIEIYITIFSIKYIFKYIFKGDDRIIISYWFIKDKIEKHLFGRYIRSTQAAIRIIK